MAKERSLTKTLDGADRATADDFNDEGRPTRPLHLKRGDPRAEQIEGKPKFKQLDGAQEADQPRRARR